MRLRGTVVAPLGVVALGLTLTGVATATLWKTVRDRDASRFRNAVQSTQNLIARRIDTYVTMLESTRGLMVTGLPIDVSTFRAFVAQLAPDANYPGIQGIGWSARVQANERATFQAAQTVFEGFHIWPEGERDEFFPIVMLEPLDRRNRAAIGFDMFSEPARRAAMERARDTGAVAASRRVTLVQEIDAEKQAGFLIYVPVFEGAPTTVDERRRALRGFVYAAFRADDLFHGIFGDEALPRVSFEVYDGTAARSDALLHASGKPERARLVQTVHIMQRGTPWTIVFRSRRAFEEASSRFAVFVVLASGLFATFILYAVTLTQARARVRVEDARADAEAQRNNLHALFMQTPAAVAILHGADLRFALANASYVDAFGGRPLIGRSASEALADAGEVVQTMSRVYETGEPFVGRELPFTLHTRDGREAMAYFSGTYQPLRDGQGRVEGIMAFGYDVTDLVTARQHAERLADDLARAVRARDDFLSIAGHELRTPLAALTLHIQGLRRQVSKGTFGAPSDGLIERIDKTVRQVARLERLTNELLDVSRLSAGRLVLDLEEVDFGAVVRDVVDRSAAEAARAGCPIVVLGTERVRGRWDRVRLEQIVTNLVANALKYGAGRPVELTLEATATSARLLVRDHGMGIAPADRERIFQRFERAVSDRQFGGLGLGLWITRQIVDALGGLIGVRDDVTDGAAFEVELPLAGPRPES